MDENEKNGAAALREHRLLRQTAMPSSYNKHVVSPSFDTGIAC
jgi:hypothetical protein